ncbi:MAG: VTT domain-containing protein [Candidatus Hadarchaeota archaeon]
MASKRSSFWIFGAAVTVVALVSVVFWAIAASTSQETWKSVGYPSAFLLGVIGASSVIIPIPTTVVLLAIASSRIFDPTLLAVAFGLGSAAGQLTSYAVGYAGSMVVGRKKRRQLDAMLKIFERYGMAAVFIFALTPLPDSLLFIPLGLAHYSLWKVFVAAAAGKVAMSLIITHVGGAVGQVSENWIFGVATAVLLGLLVFAMFKIDWEKFVQKYLPEKKRKK